MISRCLRRRILYLRGQDEATTRWTVRRTVRRSEADGEEDE
jgi:hypothetical protein